MQSQLTGQPAQPTDVLAGPPDGAPLPPPRFAAEVEHVVTQPPAEQTPPPPVAEEEPPPPPPTRDTPDVSPEEGIPHHQPDIAKLEQRLRTLEGKYTSETGALRQSLQQRDDRIATLTSQVGDLTVQLLQVNQTRSLTPEVDPDTLTEDEVRDFGPDLVNAIERRARAMARHIVSAETADLRDKLTKLGGNVEQLDTRSQIGEKERFHSFMDQNHPAWREIDLDPDFKAWLEQVDPFSGSARKFGLTAAIRSGEWTRVVSIFKGYEKERQVVTPTPVPDTKRNGNGRVRLETLAVPAGGRGRTEAIDPVDRNAPEAPVTQAQVRQFYATVSRPHHVMTEAEIAMEARILRDVAAGRVVVQSRV
jgi:hypothetical protein